MLGRLSASGILGAHGDDDTSNVSNNTLYRCCFAFLQQYKGLVEIDPSLDRQVGRDVIRTAEDGIPVYEYEQRSVFEFVHGDLAQGNCIDTAMSLFRRVFPDVVNIRR